MSLALKRISGFFRDQRPQKASESVTRTPLRLRSPENCFDKEKALQAGQKGDVFNKITDVYNARTNVTHDLQG